MTIENINKNGGTVASPIFSADIDNISFKNIPAGSKGTKGSTFWNNSANADVWTTNGDASKWKPSVNAVDIDWNDANLYSAVNNHLNDSGFVEGLQVNNINTTGDLLNVIAHLQAEVTILSNLVKGLYKALGTSDSNSE